jgi:hypothetical protein
MGTAPATTANGFVLTFPAKALELFFALTQIFE